MRILMIEDEPESVASLMDEVRGKEGFECRICGFDQAERNLEEFRPEVVILDLLKQAASGAPTFVGGTPFEYVWNRRFGPIIVYSAQPEALDTEEHPFVRKVQKGAGSEVKVVEALTEFAPHVSALASTLTHIDQILHQALREVAPVLYGQSPDVLLGAARRQVAARLDMEWLDAEPLRAWEQYVIPPVYASLATGDILREEAGSQDEPTSYRIVLTPTCDLATMGGRSAKVEGVLVAQCSPVTGLLPALNPSSGRFNAKVKDKLPRTLTAGFLDGLLPLPAFHSILPTMLADFRKLTVIPLDRISTTGSAEFRRVAAIDSPFRELVTWAYLQIAGRPGMPDRDIDTWAKEICEVLEGGGSDNEGS